MSTQDNLKSIELTIENILERRQSQIDAKSKSFNTLLQWAKEVSEKTGIPMPQL